MFSTKIDKHKFKEIERKREFREEAKSRLNISGIALPSFAKTTYTGRIICNICEREYGEPTSFKLHVKEAWHRDKLQSLKDELDVQRAVNDHVRRLMANDDRGHAVKVDEDVYLRKREPEGVLVLEEREAPEINTSNKERSLLEGEVFEEKDEIIDNEQERGASSSRDGNMLLENVPGNRNNDVKLDIAKTIIKEKENTQEERMRSKLEQDRKSVV